MVRRSVLAMFAVLAVVLGGVVVSTPAGAVVDTAVVVPSPNVGTRSNFLSSVSCVSATECVAVGYRYTGSAFQTLVMVWDGVEWLIVSSPNAGTSNDRLLSVSCESASECVAVGYTQAEDFSHETLVMAWDGVEWSIVSSPNAGTSNDRLLSVSCVSATECVAVGRTDTDSGTETLVMVWDGIEWSIVASPNAGTNEDQLDSVSCMSAAECVAVGRTWTGSAIVTLVLVWDGVEWSIMSSPNVGTMDNELFSVSCVSASECVAVGYSYPGLAPETLVVALTGPEPLPTTTTTGSITPVVPAFTG